MTFAFHPLAKIFPLLEGADFENLVADIREHGQLEPIVIYDDMVLDGRNRYRACIAAGIEPNFVPFRGDDPLTFVISANLHRRHLDESQRAMVAAKLATLQRGSNQHAPIGAPSQDEAADMLNVGRRSVQRAREVLDQGAEELRAAVERGEVSVAAAADVATLPQQEQAEIVARGEREILETAKAIRTKKAEQRYAARLIRIAETRKSNAALPLGRRYPIIYADPPWDFQLYNEITGAAHATAEHYPTMKLDEISALPVGQLAADTSILFLWTTAPHLRESFQVLDAWGFEYKTGVVWAKNAIGLGYFIRVQHEHLLIATRGDFPCPLPANRPPSVISAARREHSPKPDEAYELIERMYPNLPRIELFARGPTRPGWDAWGNEASLSAETA